MALFGKTAKQWREQNPKEKGNIRDYANVSQLVPLPQHLSRIKLKLFGASGVGKTTLIESMKCGMFSGWFCFSYTSTF
jgi:putative ribosome biogenesis GTPase RsgA